MTQYEDDSVKRSKSILAAACPPTDPDMLPTPFDGDTSSHLDPSYSKIGTDSTTSGKSGLQSPFRFQDSHSLSLIRRHPDQVAAVSSLPKILQVSDLSLSNTSKSHGRKKIEKA